MGIWIFRRKLLISWGYIPAYICSRIGCHQNEVSKENVNMLSDPTESKVSVNEKQFYVVTVLLSSSTT